MVAELSLEIDASSVFDFLLFQPEEKRANARKHLNLRKRKALATLFKTLSSMGKNFFSTSQICSHGLVAIFSSKSLPDLSLAFMILNDFVEDTNRLSCKPQGIRKKGSRSHAQ